jgi:epoxyqueuosine reductase
MRDAAGFKQALLRLAQDAGFPLAGVAPARHPPTAAAFRAWLEAGYAGEMGYLERAPERRCRPELVWPAAQSVLVVGLPYWPHDRDGPEERELRQAPGRGQVARYALGDDYHEVMSDRLRALLSRAQEEAVAFGEPHLQGRVYVDTGPLLERALAARAGLGWFGKNTCLLDRHYGSYFFLGAVLLDVPLPPDPSTTAHCGSCERCLSACPTGAFVSPYVLDARRCISYLTIELKGPIPRELRPLIGNWIFGCDVCQEVCPWNSDSTRPDGRRLPPAMEPALAPRTADAGTPVLTELLQLTQEEFSRRYRASPIKRAKRRGLLRNVCVAMGNSGDPAALGALLPALAHEEPLVRGHAAWAVEVLAASLAPCDPRRATASAGVAAALQSEADPWVRAELEAARAALVFEQGSATQE